MNKYTIYLYFESIRLVASILFKDFTTDFLFLPCEVLGVEPCVFFPIILICVVNNININISLIHIDISFMDIGFIF